MSISRSRIWSMYVSLTFMATFILYYFYRQTFSPVTVGSGRFGQIKPPLFSVRNLLWTEVDTEPEIGKIRRKFGWTYEGGLQNNGTVVGDDDDSDVECREVHNLNKSQKCFFVQNTSDCQIDEGFIDYTTFAYCSFDPDLVPIPLIILFVWWLFLFVGLAVTADDFFCPSLTVISKTLHLSHNIAGVTFLAFGNGAPDIFSAIAAIGNAKNGDAGLAIGALFGAGVFVTTIVAGTIAVICPFDAMQRPFLRDVIFYMAATFWTFWILWKKEISKIEAIGFILLYVGYVLVVVLGRYIYQKQKGPVLLSETTISPDGDDDKKPNSNIQTSDDEDIEKKVIIERDRERQPLLSPIQKGLTDSTVSTLTDEDEKTPLQEFLSAINPIDTENWSQMNLIKKIYEIFKSPLMFLLIITIPVVDYGEDKHKWNRHLNVLHCITGPVFGSLATKVGLNTIGDVFPVWALLLIIGVVLAILVFVKSQNNIQPVYHAAFAYLGFIVAVIWIYSIANEIVNILQSVIQCLALGPEIFSYLLDKENFQTFGIVFNISNAILGLTLLAWGNSIGDLIADTVMARQGYPRMGISACFGGPLFNLLLGIGIPFTIGTIQNGGSYQLQITLEEVVLAAFLMLSLITSLIVVPLSKFRMSRPYGIILVVLYVVFLVVAILAETGAITADID